MKYTILLALLGLCSCAGSPVVVMNPKTHEIAQCNTNSIMASERYFANDDCAKAYESQGWKRVEVTP